MRTQGSDEASVLCRLAKVERENRALRLMWLLVLALVVVLSLSCGKRGSGETKVADTIKTRHLIVVDEAGRPMVKLDARGIRMLGGDTGGRTELNNTGLSIKWKYYPESEEVTRVSLGPDGLVVTDESGAAKLAARGLAMIDAKGIVRAFVGCGRVLLHDETGMLSASLHVSEEDRSGRLQLHYDNNETWTAP